MVYYCYQCRRGVNAAENEPLRCSQCEGQFIEEMNIPGAQEYVNRRDMGRSEASSQSSLRSGLSSQGDSRDTSNGRRNMFHSRVRLPNPGNLDNLPNHVQNIVRARLLRAFANRRAMHQQNVGRQNANQQHLDQQNLGRHDSSSTQESSSTIHIDSSFDSQQDMDRHESSSTQESMSDMEIDSSLSSISDEPQMGAVQNANNDPVGVAGDNANQLNHAVGIVQNLQGLNDVLRQFMDNMVDIINARANDEARHRNFSFNFVGTFIRELVNENNPPQQGMTDEQLAQLSKVRISEEQIRDETDCKVCLEMFKLDEEVISLPCEHVFHETCIFPWLKLQHKCPTCRRDADVEEEPNLDPDELD